MSRRPLAQRGRPCHCAKWQRRVDGVLVVVACWVCPVSGRAGGERRFNVLRSGLTPPSRPYVSPLPLRSSAPLPPLSPSRPYVLPPPHPTVGAGGRRMAQMQTIVICLAARSPKGGGRAIAPNRNGGWMGYGLLLCVGFAPCLGERAARGGSAFFVQVLRRPPAPTFCPRHTPP
ncbi:MAG: hypothetical protein OT477_22775 [Chloroflexi bacterium]|nr:hypothetical protein [Chloroflexota bacterium]